MSTKEKAAGLGTRTASKSEHTDNSNPDSKTVKGRVLAALLQGRRLTHKDIWFEFGSSRASHHVYSLRKEGWPIITEIKEVPTSDGGRKAQIAEYRLPPDCLEDSAA